jgi:galactosylgalactosylxylosylprotein 3-beta-glucuronosyltransferase 1
MLGVGKSKTLLEGPVCDSSQVVGWHTNERDKRQRRFHVNTSGFAFNSSMLWDADKRAHQAWNYIRLLDTVRDGFQVRLLLMSPSKTSISENRSIRVAHKIAWSIFR